MAGSVKDGLTNVDVAALARELDATLSGARFDKAFQPEKDAILLRLRRKGLGRVDLFFRLGKYLTVMRRPPSNPDQPSMVAKILRQKLDNARLVRVQQVGFDRVIRMDFQKDVDHSLVFEIFGDGNLLLLDAEDVILLPMRGAEHGARRLKRGEPYVPPPGSAQPLTMNSTDLANGAREWDRDVFRFLALGLGFGPQWAKELCLRAGVDGNALAADVDAEAIYQAITAVGASIAANDLEAAVVYRAGEAVDAVPFTMGQYNGDQFAYEEAPSFFEALDVFFHGDADEEEDPRQARFDEAKARLQRQLDQMAGALAGFEEEEAERKVDGDTLYAHFQDVQALLDAMRDAHARKGWDGVREDIARGKAAGHPAASLVDEVRHDGKAILALTTVDGETRRIQVDVLASVQENADRLYEAGKKARSRHAGAIGAFRDAEQRMKELEAKGLDGFGAAPKKKEVSKHFWFEAHRWTVTPGGFLAVGGRNAAGNDAVVKKYMRDGDRYVHANIHGAPSVVVRPADGSMVESIPDEDLEVAGQFAVCASRAWRQFGEASAYWVTPQQVNKTPRSGEFVPRGAWIIHGKRNPLDRLPTEWAVGPMRFTNGGVPVPPGEEAPVTKLLGGPPQAVRTWCSEMVSVKPGTMDPNEAAAALAQRFDVDIQEAQGVLPPGPVVLEGL